MTRNLLCALLLVLIPQVAAAACRDMDHDGTSYTVCEATGEGDLRLFQTAPDGQPFGTFDRVNESLVSENRQLAFAMNAGMYHPGRTPVGLTIVNGTRVAPIVTAAGPGNFGLLPNGVFCIGKTFTISESRAFAAAPPACRHATQSGPMLVIDGALHPRFLPASTSRHIRNGVGVSADGTRAYFVISNSGVTFHQFARLFRDGLDTPTPFTSMAVSRGFTPRNSAVSTPAFRWGPSSALSPPVDAATWRR